ncbi:MAG: SDR family NAD(P)-dependent oxidoreductase [Chloroflexota bacterium]
MRLADRVAIVTGAARGIGRGIALRYAEEGAVVVIADILDDMGRETAEMIRQAGGQALAIEMDVSQRSEVESTVAQVMATFGRVDILVNDAGITGRMPLLQMTEDDWDRMIDVNLKGPFLCSQAVVREMIGAGRKGKIVNIASIESEAACPDQAHYAASKGGLLMLTRALAYDLAPFGINVNAIGPGTTDSGRGHFDDPAVRARYETRIPWARVAVPRDIANAAVFLASDEAEYITGTILYVDGGCLIKYAGVQ